MSADMNESAALNLNLTPDEKRLYGQLFRQADTGSAGIVTGDVAVSFFEKTRLDSRVLGEIWQIADKENRGFLTPQGFGIVLRLIGHAQAGREPTSSLALEPGPLPRFDGIGPPVPVGSPPPPSSLQPQGSGGVRIPPLTTEKVAQYTGLFDRQALPNGTMPGDQAKQIFEKSGLPNEVLGRIWMLADTEQRGALVQAEFIIAMHLLTSMKTGSLRALPNVLPAALYEAATRRASPVAPRQSPQSTGVAASAIPRQLSGTAQRTGSPLGRPPIGPQSTGQGDWAVTPGDKAKFDHIFTDLDKGNKGYITGEEAVPFFKQSGLQEDALAQIWDLADVLSHGHLSRDEFAVAMFLIRQQRGNRSASLPATLPPNLIPPSLRNRQPQASAFEPPAAPAPQPPPQPKSALDDLFGLDSTSASPAPEQSAAGSTASDPFASGAPSPPPKPGSSGMSFKPFVPSSTFGRGLSKQPTGDSTPSSFQQPAGDDLLGDNDPEVSKKLTGETAELANLSNQIGSLSKQMQDTQTKRNATQNELNQANSQKQNFEQRLSQLRTLYEKEAQDTRALEEQLRTARTETQKLQGECMNLEGTYKDVQTQHQELMTALQADQQENTNLRERIRVVNTEIAQLKPQIEKLKSDARQQKGLVAINKKQLSTTENEREKLKTEAEELTKSNEELSRQVNTGSPASPSAKVASPALSTASGNNPFFNRTGSTDVMGAFASPPPRSFTENTFDDVFGPAAPAASSATPPPPTSFKQQNTGNSAASISSAPNASPSVSRQATLAFEPPPPPESRQLTSSSLPLPEHSDSLTSSRQVSPPASRGESTATETQGPFSGEVAKFPSAHEAFSGDDLEKNEPTENLGPAETNKATEGSSAAVESSDAFANTDQAKAKAEFDNAFAAFTSASKTTQDKSVVEPSKNRSAFDTEFPPISSLEKDDESDSDSDGAGFDDDFAPTSPPQQLGTETKAVVDAEAPKAESGPKDTQEQPSSPATLTTATATAPNPQQSSVDDIFGSADTAPTPTAGQPAPAAAPGKGTFDDSEDEFEGLEEAKEGSGYEDFADISRSGLEDFNPVFDSSPPGSQAKSESTAFGNGSSFDFISSGSANAAAPAPSTQPKAAESQDWDAIFAGLDSPSATAAVPSANNASSEKTDGLAVPDRPAVGRALTDEGVHDDPIVKDLVSMGYTRDAAVDALEKHNYNLEKAANHLAGQS